MIELESDPEFISSYDKPIADAMAGIKEVSHGSMYVTRKR